MKVCRIDRARVAMSLMWDSCTCPFSSKQRRTKKGSVRPLRALRGNQHSFAGKNKNIEQGGSGTRLVRVPNIIKSRTLGEKTHAATRLYIIRV